MNRLEKLLPSEAILAWSLEKTSLGRLEMERVSRGLRDKGRRHHSSIEAVSTMKNLSLLRLLCAKAWTRTGWRRC